MLAQEHLDALKEIMQELESKMQYDSDDFDERLGRNPKVQVMKIEAVGPDKDGVDLMDEDDPLGEEEGPEMKLKKRIMNLRR